MNFIIKNFLRGLVIVIPVAVTVWILVYGFIWIDRLLRIPYPGVGFALTVISIIVIGFLASNFLTRRIFTLMDRIFVRAPFVKIVYSSIKDLIEAFVGDRKRFNRPVLVHLSPDGAISALGFVTREDAGALGMAGRVAVYFPQSYNFAGQLLLVKASAIEPLPIDSSTAMPFIVSGGVSGVE